MSVYFIRAGRYFKIGFSEEPGRRFAGLHQGSARYTFPADAPLALAERELYRVIEGSRSREAAIHLALGDFSVGLEWFLDEPALRVFIDSLSSDEPRVNRVAKVARPGGHCAAEYLAVQQGRAERATAAHLARRAS